MADVKLRLKAGGREIELEGTFTDVEKLLDKWWMPAAAGADDEYEENEDGDDGGARNDRTIKPARKRAARRASAAAGDGAVKSTHDATDFANKVKQDKKFAQIKNKIIVANPSLLRRIEFVFWFTGASLTSGDVKRSLEALGIKSNTPQISKSLDANKDRFLFSGQRVKGAIVRYTMTSAALDDFEKWLNGDG